MLQKLPLEIRILVFNFLSVQDVCTVALVSKCCHEAASDSLIRSVLLKPATHHGKADIVKHILSRFGGHLEASDNSISAVFFRQQRLESLKQAVKNGDIDIVNLLLDSPGFQWDSSVIPFYSNGNVTILRALCAAASGNAQLKQNVLDEALIIACRPKDYGDGDPVEFVSELLLAGANAKRRDSLALCHASCRGFTDTVITLVTEGGANVRCQLDGAIRWAANVEIIQFFRQHSIVSQHEPQHDDVHAVNTAALVAACRLGKNSLVHELIDNGVHLTYMQDLALRTAFAMKHDDIVAILIDAGANANIIHPPNIASVNLYCPYL